jgi:hypothetical protein
MKVRGYLPNLPLWQRGIEGDFLLKALKAPRETR